MDGIQAKATNLDEAALAMAAAVVRFPDAPFEFEEVILAPPRADELLVRLVATGMCHTDLSAKAGELQTPLPIVLGHEGAGVVVSVGSAVTTVQPGDHVVLGYLSCGSCPECLSGETASCRQLGPLCFSGARPDGSHALCGKDGSLLHDRFFGQSSFAPFAIAHERGVVKVPKDAPLELLGPLGCGVMTGAGAVWNVLKVGPGGNLAVYGAGAVGLSAAMAAKVAGATMIICVDRIESRLELALELGATHVINADKENPLEAIQRITASGVASALDTTGRGDMIQVAASALQQRGTLAVVGISMAGGEHKLDLLDMIMGCKRIVGVIEGGGTADRNIARLIELHKQGRFPFDRLLRFYDVSEINQAAADSLSGSVIKPIIRFAS